MTRRPASAEPPAPPGRPREFDCAEALDSIVAAVWQGGFVGTTYGDLERATGLHGQSLVYAFGDKRALFHAALRHYAESRVQAVIDRLGAEGAMPLESIAELGRDDPDVAVLLEAATDRLIAPFRRTFERALGAGQLGRRDVADPPALARLAVTVGDGALLRSRTAGSARTAAAAFGAFLTLLRR